MNELKRHIEVLLLQNDCVIVPDFGGFMAHHVSARYDEEERIYLPPMRTLGFNPQLRMNDSLLVQSYVEAYDISYPEALRRIEDEVSLLRKQLDEKGCYTMDGLGELTINTEGNYEFQPCAAGILSPELYGLNSVAFLQLGDSMPIATDKQTLSALAASNDADKENAQENIPSPTLLDFTDTDEDDEHAISIKMSWIRNAIAVAAAVLAFFFIATPVANSNLSSETLSQMKSNVLYRLMPQDTSTPSSPAIIEEKEQNVATTTTMAIQKTEDADSYTKEDDHVTTDNNTKEKELHYTIVLASQVKKSNAEYFVEQLHKAGYKDAQVYIHNNVVRVIYGEFETQAKAYQELNTLHGKQDFEEAWVYKKTEV